MIETKVGLEVIGDLPLFARATDPETSHRAAASHKALRAEQRRKLAVAFEAAGGRGLNADEADAACDFYIGTAGRRLHEMMGAKVIEKTGVVRATRRGGTGEVYRRVANG